jgi:hypothetical protein
MATSTTTVTTTPSTSVPSWLVSLFKSIGPVLQAILDAVANYNWAGLFPNFAGLIQSILALLKTLFGLATATTPVVA